MITKTDAAERQLNTAIRLFFENRDHLSSYALAVASREVTDDVIQSRYSELYQRELARVGDPLEVRLSYRDEIELRIKPEFYKDFLKLRPQMAKLSQARRPRIQMRKYSRSRRSCSRW